MNFSRFVRYLLALLVSAGLAAPTAYAFDKDKGKVSSCYGECAKHWPPYAVQKGEKMGKDWAKTKRKDGDPMVRPEALRARIW